MTRIKPLRIEDTGDSRSMIESGYQTMGFESEDALIMARSPKALSATASLIESILGSQTVDGGLKRMMGYVVSNGNQCKYCSAHTSFTAGKNGVSEEKMKAIYSFNSSELFSEAERAALQLAMHSVMQPNQVSDADFERLKRHYTEDEITELVFTISLYQFLNSFNTSMNTDIEEKPLMALNKLNTER